MKRMKRMKRKKPTVKYLWRDDGERFTRNKDGTFSMDSTCMAIPYKWTYTQLIQTGKFFHTRP